MEDYLKGEVKERFDDLDYRERLNIVRNGYVVLEAINSLEEDEVYSRDLCFTGRTASEVGLTLSAFESLYDIELREFDEEKEFWQTYSWNIDRLRDREENGALKELLNW